MSAHQQDTTLFHAVDRSADPDFFLRFLDAADAVTSGRPYKKVVADRLALDAGKVVLNVGCGTGSDAATFARQVPGGRVVGVDLSESMIAEAGRRCAGLDLPITFETGDVRRLRFPDNSFDAVHSERVLIHVPDPREAIAEMARVTRPGGRVCVAEIETESFLIDSAHRDITRRILASFADSMQSGWVGRQLPRLFTECGLGEITVHTETVTAPFTFMEYVLGGHLTRAQADGVLSPDEARRWWEQLRRTEQTGTFRAEGIIYVVATTT